jgi:hypothetical protein
MVEMLVAGGTPQRTIANALGITSKCLREHYREEITLGRERATARVVQRLFTSIQAGSVAAMIFYLKARAGWKEGQKIEIERVTPPLERLSRADRDRLRQILTKTGATEHARLVGAPTQVEE